MRKKFLLNIIFITAFFSIQAQTGIITTVAGNQNYGYSGDGGIATSAELAFSAGVAIDTLGNLFIADTENNIIRMVSATTGIITTVAGKAITGGSGGYGGYSGDNGLAIDAELSWPTNVAVDLFGNLYISDYGNGVIRKVTASTGIITTVATSHIYIWSVAVDSFGNIYIVDRDNHQVKKLSISTGSITVVAGNGFGAGTGSGGYTGDNGPATSAELDSPYGVAIDAVGNIYIADSYNHVIRKVEKSTRIITTVVGNGIWGYSGDGGPASAAKLNFPTNVSLDIFGNIYILDEAVGVVRKVTASTGIITTIAGNGTQGYSGDAGLATSAQFYDPFGLAVDRLGKNIYIGQGEINNVIRKVMMCSELTAQIIPNGPTIFCNGGSVILTSDSSKKYLWSDKSTSRSITVTNSGNYRITTIDSLGCSTTTATVSVHPIPTIPIITQIGDTLISSSVIGNQWYLNNGILTGKTGRKLTVTQNGAYTVVVSDDIGCSSLSSQYVIFTAGIYETSYGEKLIKVFPNPTRGDVTINLKLNYQAEVVLDLYNVIGEKIISISNKIQSEGIHNFQINSGEINKGIYFVKGIIGLKFYSEKLIIE